VAKDTITPNKNVKEDSEKKNAMNFVNETKEELSKVVWPTRQQLFSESAAVILMVILVATIISLVDKLFIWGAGKVF
jgi:preprotein translocase subunit SecE